MEAMSGIDELYDPLELISQKPNKGRRIKSQILNTAVPSSFIGEAFVDVGDHYTYCITSKSAKIFGDYKFLPNSCQVKIKMRAIGAFNKLPGMPKLSGYPQINVMNPAVMASQSQSKVIIERM